jgi:hypothetical protein
MLLVFPTAPGVESTTSLDPEEELEVSANVLEESSEDRAPLFEAKSQELEEYWAAFILIMFFAFRTNSAHGTTLKLANESWWTTLRRLGPSMSARNKQRFRAMWENVIPNSVRTQTRKEFEREEIDARADYANNSEGDFISFDATDDDDDVWNVNPNGESALQTRRRLEFFEEHEGTAKDSMAFVDRDGKPRMKSSRVSATAPAVCTSLSTSDVQARVRELVVAHLSNSVPGDALGPDASRSDARSKSFTDEMQTNYKLTLVKELPLILEVTAGMSREEIADVYCMDPSQRLIFYPYHSRLALHMEGRGELDDLRPHEYPQLGFQLKAIVAGPAGCGKSYVFRALDAYVACHGRRYLILKLAQYNAAAAGVNGSTCHGYTSNKDEEISKAVLLIVEEGYTCSREVLYDVHSNACRVKSNNSWMGGMHVMWTGDHFQTEVIGAGQVYAVPELKTDLKASKTKTLAQKQIEARQAYDKTAYVFNQYMETWIVVVLTTQNRFKDQPRLLHLTTSHRLGIFTVEDVVFLNSRRCSIEDVDVRKSVIMTSTRRMNKVMKRCSETVLLQTTGDCCIAWYAKIEGEELMDPQELEDVRDAVDDARFAKDKPKYQQYLPAFSIGYVGKRSVLTHTLNGDAQIAKGVVGTEHSYHFTEGPDPVRVTLEDGRTYHLYDRLPSYVMVEIEDGADIPGLGRQLRPVWAVECSIPIVLRDGTKRRVSVTNIALESGGTSTVHAVQGKSLVEDLKVVITDYREHWPSFPTSGDYVSWSRAKKEFQLDIITRHPYTLQSLSKLVPRRGVIEEYSRLVGMFSKCANFIDPDFVYPEIHDCQVEGGPELRPMHPYVVTRSGPSAKIPPPSDTPSHHDALPSALSTPAGLPPPPAPPASLPTPVPKLPFYTTTSPSITDGTSFNVVEITAPVWVEYNNKDFGVLRVMNAWLDDASIRLFPFLEFNRCGILSYYIFEPHFLGGGIQNLTDMLPGRKQHMMDYLNKKFVLLPYHKSANHWGLFVLVKTGATTRNLLYFDSLYDHDTTDLDLGLCSSLLGHFFLQHSIGITVEGCFSLTTEKHQKDSYSCGVYLIRAAAAVAEHARLYNHVDADLSQFHVRFRFPTEFQPRPYRETLVNQINGFLGKIVAPATSASFQEGSFSITATNKFTPGSFSDLHPMDEEEETSFL